MSAPRPRVLLVVETSVPPTEVACQLILRWSRAAVHVVVLRTAPLAHALAAAMEDTWMGVTPFDPSFLDALHRAESSDAEVWLTDLLAILRRWGLEGSGELAGHGDHRTVAVAGGRDGGYDVLVRSEPCGWARRWWWSRQSSRLSRLSGLPVVDLGWTCAIGTNVSPPPLRTPA